MNTTTLEGKWEQLKGKVREAWGNLTEDDVEKVKGNLEELKGRIKERYGYASERINDEVAKFVDSHKDETKLQ